LWKIAEEEDRDFFEELFYGISLILDVYVLAMDIFYVSRLGLSYGPVSGGFSKRQYGLCFPDVEFQRFCNVFIFSDSLVVFLTGVVFFA